MTNCSNLANATNSSQRLPDPDLFSDGEYSPAADHDQRHDRDGPKTLLFIGAIVAAIIVIPATAFLIGHYMGRRAAPIRRAVTSYGNLEV